MLAGHAASRPRLAAPRLRGHVRRAPPSPRGRVAPVESNTQPWRFPQPVTSASRSCASHGRRVDEPPAGVQATEICSRSTCRARSGPGWPAFPSSISFPRARAPFSLPLACPWSLRLPGTELPPACRLPVGGLGPAGAARSRAACTALDAGRARHAITTGRTRSRSPRLPLHRHVGCPPRAAYVAAPRLRRGSHLRSRHRLPPPTPALERHRTAARRPICPSRPAAEPVD